MSGGGHFQTKSGSMGAGKGLLGWVFLDEVLARGELEKWHGGPSGSWKGGTGGDGSFG